MFDLSRSEHQDFLCCFQNLHHFFKTSQAVREASKTSIGQGFPGAVLFNETYFCLHICTEIFVQVCTHVFLLRTTLYSSMYVVCMALTKLEMNTAVTSWK